MYNIDDDLIEEIYETIFTKKDNFIHQANPASLTHANYVYEALQTNTRYFDALIITLAILMPYQEALNRIDDYDIYEGDEARETAFINLATERAEDDIEAHIPKHLISYMNTAQYIDDCMYNYDYVDILSNYDVEEIIELNSITYYVYEI